MPGFLAKLRLVFDMLQIMEPNRHYMSQLEADYNVAKMIFDKADEMFDDVFIDPLGEDANRQSPLRSGSPGKQNLRMITLG